MIAVAPEVNPRAFERGECQRRLGNRQDALARGAELAQKSRAGLGIRGLGRLAHSAVRAFRPRPGSLARRPAPRSPRHSQAAALRDLPPPVRPAGSRYRRPRALRPEWFAPPSWR